MPADIPVVTSTNMTRSKQKVKMFDRMQQVHTSAALIQPVLDMNTRLHRCSGLLLAVNQSQSIRCCTMLTLGAAALEGVKVSEDKVPPMDLVLRASPSWLALLSRDALLSACLSATMAEASACSKTSAVITWYKRSLTQAWHKLGDIKGRLSCQSIAKEVNQVSGLPPWEAPIMMDEKYKLFFSFRPVKHKLITRAAGGRLQ